MGVPPAWFFAQALVALAPGLVHGTLQDDLERASPGDLKVLLEFGMEAPRRNSVAVHGRADVKFRGNVTPGPGVDSSDTGLVHVHPQAQIEVDNHGLTYSEHGYVNRWTIMMDIAIDEHKHDAWTGLYCVDVDTCVGGDSWHVVENGFQEIGTFDAGYAEVEMLVRKFYRIVVTANLNYEGTSRKAYYLNGRLLIDAAGKDCFDCEADWIYAAGRVILILPKGDASANPARLTTVALWDTDLTEEAIIALGPPSFGAEDAPQCAAMDIVGALLTRPALPSLSAVPNTCGRTCCHSSGAYPCREIDMRWRYNADTGACEQDPSKQVCSALVPKNEANIPHGTHPFVHFGVFCTALPSSAASTRELALGFAAPDIGLAWTYASLVAFFAAVKYFFAGHVIPVDEIDPLLREVRPIAFFIKQAYLGSDSTDPSIDYIPTLQDIMAHPEPGTAPAGGAGLSRNGTVFFDNSPSLRQLLRGPDRPPAPLVLATVAWEEVCDAASRAGLSVGGATGTDGTGFTIGGRCMPTTLWRETERDVGFGYTAKCKQWKLLFRELGIVKFGYIYTFASGVSGRFLFLNRFFNKCFERCAIQTETSDSELQGTCLQDSVEICYEDYSTEACLNNREALLKMKSGVLTGASQPNDIRVLLLGIGDLWVPDMEKFVGALEKEGVTGDKYQLIFYGTAAAVYPMIMALETQKFGRFLDGAILLTESCDGERWDDFTTFLRELKRSDFPTNLDRLDEDKQLNYDVLFGTGYNADNQFARVLRYPSDDGGGVVDAGLGITVDATVTSLMVMNHVLRDLGHSLHGLPSFVLDAVSRNVSFPGACGGTVSFDADGQRRSAIKMKLYSIVPARQEGDWYANWKPRFMGSVTESAFTPEGRMRFSKGRGRIVEHVHPYCVPGHEGGDDLRCHKCKPGSYSDMEGRYLKCLPCEPGTFSDQEGSVACSACVVGTIAAAEGLTACDPCEVGSFQPAQMKSSCILCGPGTSTSERGAERCTPCPRGKYQELEGQGQCDPCIGGRETPDTGAASRGMCGCPVGKYEGSNATCAPCPSTGLMCPGGVSPPLQAAGYAASPAPQGALPLRLVNCQDELSCPEGLPMGECPGNRTGMACGRCKAGFVEVEDRQCQLCEERGAGVHVPFLFGVLAFFALLGVVFAYALKSPSAAHHQSKIAVMITFGLVTQALQAISAFANFSITWVEPIAALQRVLAIFTLDIFTLECSLDIESEAVQYLLTLIVYPAFATVLQLGFYLYSKFRRRISPDNQLNVHGVVLMLAYLPILLISLKPWQCNTNPDGTFSVRSMRNVECWGEVSSQHTTMIICSFFSFFGLCIGYLALAGWAVLSYPSRVVRMDGGQFLKRFRFLFYHFTVEHYFYSLVHTARSLALALLPVLLTSLPRLQLMIVQMAVVIALILQVRFFPWRSAPCNVLDAVLSFNLLLIITVGIMLGDKQAGDGATAQICLLVYLLCILIGVLGVGSFHGLRVLFPKKPFGAFVCHHKAGAGSMARWLKTELGAKVTQAVFLDSDNLHNLDTLFHMVAHQTNNLIVLLTRDILLRPWCAGEMATAVATRLNIIPVMCGDFPGFTDDAINDAGSRFSGSDISMLATLGVTMPMIRAAFQHIRTLAPQPINRSDPYIIHEQLVDAVMKRLQKVTVRVPPFFVSRRNEGQEHSVVILGSRHPEANITCHVIRMLLQRELQKGVVVLDCPLDEAVSRTKHLTHVIVVLVPGILNDVQFACYLMMADSKAMLLGVRADDAFSFPDVQFWSDLSGGLVLDANKVNLKEVTRLYKKLFATIATSFSPLSSSRVHEAEIQQLITRMHTARVSEGGGTTDYPTSSEGEEEWQGDAYEEDEDEGASMGMQVARTASRKRVTIPGVVKGVTIPGVVPADQP